ncbi:hypothetical protein [Streptomyces sp. NPDC059788]|uniref:hypothetical protein n=1 Tax=Streptomyces sp. NPDC059788 TaxID=3346948 RepID=UPI00365F1190
MTYDESRPCAADQLATVASAPDLSRPASGRERAAGLATLVVLYVGLVIAMESDLPRPAGIAVFVGALALLLAWSSHHDGAARRRPQTRVENAARFGAVCLLALPGVDLVFDEGPDTLTAHLVAAAVPAVAAAVFLVLRWKR